MSQNTQNRNQSSQQPKNDQPPRTSAIRREGLILDSVESKKSTNFKK